MLEERKEKTLSKKKSDRKKNDFFKIFIL